MVQKTISSAFTFAVVLPDALLYHSSSKARPVPTSPPARCFLDLGLVSKSTMVPSGLGNVLFSHSVLKLMHGYLIL